MNQKAFQSIAHSLPETEHTSTRGKAYIVSLVIPTKGRHESILRSLDAVLSCLPAEISLEIIVIEETDVPQPIREERVKYCPIPERGLGFGYVRNLSLEKAKGSIVIFIDDDVFPSQDWFKNLLQPFQDESVGAVGGAILPDLRKLNEIGKAISLLGFPGGGLSRYLETNGKRIETNLISTGNCAFRASLARRIGGFDESLRFGGEDQDFFARISELSKTLYIPNAIVYHRQRNSFREVFRWFIRRGKAEFFRKCKVHHPIHALILPLRSNFLLKLGMFIVLFFAAMSYFLPAAIALGVATPFVWGTFLSHRAYVSLNRKITAELPSEIRKIKASIIDGKIRRILFLVKATMDLGHEVGKLTAFVSYLSHRIFSKPLVLAFHHLGNCEGNEKSSNVRYYYPIERFQNLVQDCQRDGRRIAPLSELVSRLKKNPCSLYFEKTLAITFDDAYQSLYTALGDFLQKAHMPITIFVPTVYTGKRNEWDIIKGLGPEDIMDWQHLAALKGKGVEIGSHSRHHFRLVDCDSGTRKSEIEGSLEDLQEIFPDGSGFLFSYPYGAYDEDIREMVESAGYIGAVANFSGNIRPYTDPFEIPRFTVFAENDWVYISHLSRSMWLKELLKDIRDCLRKHGVLAGRRSP